MVWSDDSMSLDSVCVQCRGQQRTRCSFTPTLCSYIPSLLLAYLYLASYPTFVKRQSSHLLGANSWERGGGPANCPRQSDCPEPVSGCARWCQLGLGPYVLQHEQASENARGFEEWETAYASSSLSNVPSHNLASSTLYFVQ
jgi:hypothetical protein